MLNLDSEVVQLHREGLLSDETAALFIARERHEIVSIYAELRAIAWLGVMLVATGVGIIVTRNLDRIGPIAICSAIGLTSGACYAYSAWRRTPSRGGTLLDDSILLLGALLLSADVGYIEHQFHLLGSAWPNHFLLLAIVHGITAYVFSSRAVLSLSIAALASWLGIERNVDTFFTNHIGTAIRAFACAGVIAVWRVVNRRSDFERVFDHFIANLALWGGLILTFRDETRIIGLTIVLALAVTAIAFGFRRRSESFLIYPYIYAVFATDIVVNDLVHDQVLILLYMIVSTIVAVAGLIVMHRRFAR